MNGCNIAFQQGRNVLYGQKLFRHRLQNQRCFRRDVIFSDDVVHILTLLSIGCFFLLLYTKNFISGATQLFRHVPQNLCGRWAKAIFDLANHLVRNSQSLCKLYLCQFMPDSGLLKTFCNQHPIILSIFIALTGSGSGYAPDGRWWMLRNCTAQQDRGNEIDNAP